MADTGEFAHVTGFVGSPTRPTVITLCGSTRYKKAFLKANKDLTFDGHIVISLGFFGNKKKKEADEVVIGEERKQQLDELHKRKIDLSDMIFVINPEGYIGKSTAGEILYALDHGKAIESLTPLPPVGTLTDIRDGVS